LQNKSYTLKTSSIPSPYTPTQIDDVRLSGNPIRIFPAIEESTPTVVAYAERGPDSNDWYNGDVTVMFSATDYDATPVVSIDPPRLISTEGATQIVTGKAIDTAGLIGYGSINIHLDKTAPVTQLLPVM
jgi:hypothetical protein